MIKAKDEYNEWAKQRQLKINGARNFAQWLTDRYGLPVNDMNNNISNWKEQLE